MESNANETVVRAALLGAFREVDDLEFYGPDHRKLRVTSTRSPAVYWQTDVLHWLGKHLACPHARRRYDGYFSVIILLDGTAGSGHY